MLTFILWVDRAYVQKLEEKLDGLVTLIQSRELGGEPHKNLLGDPTLHNHLNQGNPLLPDRHNMVSDTYVDSDVAALSACNSESYSMEPVSTPQSSNPVDKILSSQEAEAFLNVFKNEMSPSFPFIRVEDFVTAADLRRDRPFLFLCIMAVTTGNTDQKIALGKLITESLASRMYVNTERNLDLLLGILTYIAWYVLLCAHLHNLNSAVVFGRSHHLIIYKGQKTALFASASALIIDLEINRPSHLKVPTRDPNLFEAAVPSTSHFHQPLLKSFEAVEHTAEVRRALLAYFYLSSMYASPCLLTIRALT